MLLDDGQRFINENKSLLSEMPVRLPGRTTEQTQKISDLARKYYDLINRAEQNTGASIDKSEVEAVLSDARSDTANFPGDEKGFLKLFDFHDELYKNLVKAAYVRQISDMVDFAAKFSVLIGLEPDSRDMVNLANYLTKNFKPLGPFLNLS